MMISGPRAEVVPPFVGVIHKGVICHALQGLLKLGHISQGLTVMAPEYALRRHVNQEPFRVPLQYPRHDPASSLRIS